MGSTVCRAVVDDPELELVAAVDPQHAGIDLRQLGVPGTGLTSRASADAFARRRRGSGGRLHGDRRGAREPRVVRGQRRARRRRHDRLRSRRGRAASANASSSRRRNAVIAPNFAIGAVLMMRFAELAAPVLRHRGDHRAPPRREGRRAVGHGHARPRSAWPRRRRSGPPTRRPRPSSRARAAARGAGGIPIHSVRLRGLVAHQEVLLGTTGQSLTIRHDSYDRTSFMPGVLLAIKAVGTKPRSDVRARRAARPLTAG